MKVMNISLDAIQLTETDLSEYSVYHSSAQELYSLTAPAKPVALFGWRDRWWLYNSAAKQVNLNYWLFESPDDAQTAADNGRVRISAQTISKIGGLQSIYQPVPKEESELGDTVWQAGANWLFVHGTVVVLVAEVGGQVSAETTLAIAKKIINKIEAIQ